jgi:hypothetical protein
MQSALEAATGLSGGGAADDDNDEDEDMGPEAPPPVPSGSGASGARPTGARPRGTEAADGEWRLFIVRHADAGLTRPLYLGVHPDKAEGGGQEYPGRRFQRSRGQICAVESCALGSEGQGGEEEGGGALLKHERVGIMYDVA